MPNDSTLLYALDAVAEYEQLKIQLCRLIQEGHLQLTKTKYACGLDLLSTTKLPAPNVNSLIALTKVNVEFDDELPSFTLSEREDNQTVTMIRNRKEKKDVSVTDKVDEKEEEQIQEKSKLELIEVPSNPLEWYGLLAPTSLQHAQTLFNHSIELCVSIANIQAQAERRLKECEREDLNERGIVKVEEEIPALEKEEDIIIVQKDKEEREKKEKEKDLEEKEDVEKKEESAVELEKESGSSEKSEGSEENEEKDSNSSGDFVVIQGGVKVTDSSDESTVTIHKSEE